MRLLILHSRYRSGFVSGENRVVDDEVRLLREAGHDVALWDPSSEDLRGLDLVRAGGELVWSRDARREVRRRIRAGGAQIVHVHNMFPMLSPTVIRAAADEGVRVVMTLHNFRLLCLAATCMRDGRRCELCVGRTPVPGVVHRCYQGSRLASAALASSLTLHRAVRTFDRVALFLAVGELVRDVHVGAGMDPRRIRVKRNFAWPTLGRAGPGEAFVYAGRLSAEKGVATLLDAWRRVPAPLIVIGDGPQAATLRQRAPSNVTFTGVVPGVEVGRLLRSARALIVPSIWDEPGSRSVIEAFAAGVPAIASRVGSLPEMIDHDVTGLLVPPGDAPKLARAAERLLDDRESVRLGEAARGAWRDRFSPEPALADLETAYAKALSDSPTRSA